MIIHRSYRIEPTTVRRRPIAWLITLLLAGMVVGCESDPIPQGTPGGFGNGDPATVPAFRKAVVAGHTVIRLTIPNVGGGNAELIRALLTPPAVSTGDKASEADAAKMREAVLDGLAHPSAKPARLFYIGRAYALEHRRNPVVLLICDPCGTATLTMRTEGKDGDVVIAPQFDLSVLGPLFAP